MFWEFQGQKIHTTLKIRKSYCRMLNFRILIMIKLINYLKYVLMSIVL